MPRTEEEEILSLQAYDTDFNDITTELHLIENVDKIHIPQYKYNILSACHNTTVGHFGYDITEKRVKEYLRQPPSRVIFTFDITLK